MKATLKLSQQVVNENKLAEEKLTSMYEGDIQGKCAKYSAVKAGFQIGNFPEALRVVFRNRDVTV